jgi:hypothetical protein
MEKKIFKPSFTAPTPEEKESDRESSGEQLVEEEESDGSANAFEGAEIPREDDDRDLSDKDLDDLLADEA